MPLPSMVAALLVRNGFRTEALNSETVEQLNNLSREAFDKDAGATIAAAYAIHKVLGIELTGFTYRPVSEDGRISIAFHWLT